MRIQDTERLVLDTLHGSKERGEMHDRAAALHQAAAEFQLRHAEHERLAGRGESADRAAARAERATARANLELALAEEASRAHGSDGARPDGA